MAFLGVAHFVGLVHKLNANLSPFFIINYYFHGSVRAGSQEKGLTVNKNKNGKGLCMSTVMQWQSDRIVIRNRLQRE